ncbi:MAG: hypothetical protein L3J10_10165 [Sulfurimonas sp.]|nr:hypothetical protein [Sulfurimonas sp.]
MALNCYEINKINKNIKEILQNNKSCKILSLGYPDILITKEQMSKLIIDADVDKIEIRKDSIDVAATHKMEDLAYWCCESYSLFKILGANLTVMDFTDWTGKEEVVDLNYPVDEKYYELYDIVIDPGTTEHIFNIAQAMISILQITKTDGFIYHQTPLNLINHGFYNFSPTLYKDFYEDNGAILLNCNQLQSNCNEEDIALELRETFYLNAGGCNSVFIKKLEHRIDYIYPVQGKYRNSFNNKQKLDNIKIKYKDYKKIILLPYNAHSKFFKVFFNDKEIIILDDNILLKKYLDIKPISQINEVDFDIILITSITFEKKIRDKLISLGIDNKKIFLQV